MALLTDTFGCLLIALFFVLILYGIALILGAQYFNQYPSDPLYLKVLVFSLLIIGTVQATTAFVWVYDALINKYGNIFALDILPPTACVQLMSMYLSIFFSQCYFGSRIWMLSKRNIFLTGAIFASAITVLATGIITTVRIAMLGRFTLIYKIRTVAIIQDVGVVICDFLITVGLCILLHKNRSGIRSTDSLITRIVIESVNRGVILLCLAICSLALYLWKPDSMLFLLTLLPAGQLYIITVLSILYSRKSMRQKFSGGIHTLSNLTNHHSSEEAYQLPNTAVGNAVTGSGNGPISRNDDSSVEDLEAKIHVTKSIVTTWDQTT